MLVKLENISKVFDEGITEVQALKDINLEISAGDFIAISGPSGSGKTTLLNILGLLDNATTGKYYFNEKQVDINNDKHTNYLRAFNLGFIFQDFNLLPTLTAVENVEMSALLSISNNRARRQQAEYFLTQVGLKDKIHSFPDQLSGGQQQRVSVARALMGESKLILADEPTANLDFENTSLLITLMQSLNEELNITFLFSTHDEYLLKQVKGNVRLLYGQISQ